MIDSGAQMQKGRSMANFVLCEVTGIEPAYYQYDNMVKALMDFNHLHHNGKNTT